MPPHAHQLPHLLQLLDDTDPEVRKEVFQALEQFGTNLEHLLTPYLDNLEDEQQALIKRWAAEVRLTRFRQHWLEWLDEPDDALALEDALSWISYLQAEWAPEPLGDLLDQMARQFNEWHGPAQIDRLMHFLFVDQSFLPPAKDYYHPRHSNLVTVIHRRRGLQISLACIAILVGRRLGLLISGFNMPGHFMLMAHHNERITLYDVFNQGKPLPDQAHAFLEHSLQTQETTVEALQATSLQIIPRVLRNFINAYERRQEVEQARFFKELLDGLLQELKQRGMIAS